MKNKTKNKRLISFAIMAIALIGLTGCKKTAATESASQPTSDTVIAQTVTEPQNDFDTTTSDVQEEVVVEDVSSVESETADITEEKETKKDEPCYLHTFESKEVWLDKCTKRIDKVCECGFVVEGKSMFITTHHEYTPWEIITPATTTQTGLRQSTCTRCGDVMTDVLDREATAEELYEDLFAGLDLSDWDGTCSCCGRMVGDGYNGTCDFGGAGFIFDDEGECYRTSTCVYYLENGEEERVVYRSTDDKEVWIRITP